MVNNLLTPLLLSHDIVHDILAPYISGEKAGGDRFAIPSRHNVPYKRMTLKELIEGFQ